jgi:hypothetical protein
VVEERVQFLDDAFGLFLLYAHLESKDRLER